MGQSPALPVGGGFLLGGAFLMVLDRLTPHLHIGQQRSGRLPAHLSRTTMIVLAVTLHNIPEGDGGGAGLLHGPPRTPAAAPWPGRWPWPSGWGSRTSRRGPPSPSPSGPTAWAPGRAFAAGALSGVVEPIFGLLTVLVAGSVSLVMPWVLSFAAGAMIYVVVEELIPEAHLGEHSHVGTASVMCGFLVMMLLDVMLG